MAPRLSGQNYKFFKFLLSLNSEKRLRYKESNTKYRSLTWKPRSHVTILIYRTWPIENTDSDLKVRSLHYANELYASPELLQTRQTRISNKKLWNRGFWLWLSIIQESQKLTRYQSEEFSYLTNAKVYAYNKREQILFIQIAKLKKFSTLKNSSFPLRWFPSFALRIPTAHDFCVVSARTWARARTKCKRFPSN